MNNEETLESLESEFENVTYESIEESESAGSIIINNPVRVEINNADNSTSEVSETQIYLEDLAEPEEQIRVQDITKLTYSESNRSNSPDFKNLWKLTINSTEYSVLFPDGSDLVVVNGNIYNRGSSTVTGVVIDSSFSDSSYFNKSISILPLASNSTQNSVYRYGSRIYLTTFSRGTSSTSLVTDVQYVQPTDVVRPSGWQMSQEGLVISALLLFSVLVSIIGGLLRR